MSFNIRRAIVNSLVVALKKKKVKAFKKKVKGKYMHISVVYLKQFVLTFSSFKEHSKYYVLPIVIVVKLVALLHIYCSDHFK